MPCQCSPHCNGGCLPRPRQRPILVCNSAGFRTVGTGALSIHRCPCWSSCLVRCRQRPILVLYEAVVTTCLSHLATPPPRPPPPPPLLHTHPDICACSPTLLFLIRSKMARLAHYFLMNYLNLIVSSNFYCPARVLLFLLPMCSLSLAQLFCPPSLAALYSFLLG